MDHDFILDFTRDVELDPATTCLVLVDLQYATGHPDTGLGKLLAARGQLELARYRYDRIADYVLPNSLRLLEHARATRMRVLHLTYGSELDDFSDLTPQMRALCTLTNNRAGEREHEILDPLKPVAGERVLNKLTPSAFNSCPIDLTLRTWGAETLLFCGVSTNMCVEGTLRDASDLGYGCVLVEDACGTDSQAYHDASVNVLRRLFGRVMSTDDVLAELELRTPSAVIQGGART